MSRSYKRGGAIGLILLLLFLDQFIKIWIKMHFQLHESVEVTSWFHIFFTENPGMAFGMELIGKLFLSIVRIIAVGFIGYYLHQIIKKNLPFGYILSISLIFAGAIGNIIDSAFYGLLFSDSYGKVATFLPEGGGYASFLHGKVVDMFYFPLIKTILPDWIPIWGGEEFIFFRPVFNLADSAICVGVAILFIFYRHTLFKSLNNHKA